MTLVSGMSVRLCDDASSACYRGGFGLGARHTTEAAGDEGDTGKIRFITQPKVKPGGVQQGDGGTVDNALRPDVHVGTSGHLAVLCHAERIHTFVVVLTRIIRDDHAVRHHHSRRRWTRGEKSQRVTRIHDQCLLVGHFTEVLHDQTVLAPILKHRAISTVRDQLVGELRNSGIEVVVNHQHDGRSLS